MSETTATVTCWKLRLNLIVIGWKINCLLKHFNMYSQYTRQTLINSDPLCETLINCKVVRCLMVMISSNATDRVNMQSQTSDPGLQRWYYQVVVFCSVTPGRQDNTWISHRLWLGAGNETLKTEMGLTRNVIVQTSGPSVQPEEIEILCVVWVPPILNILTHNLWRIYSCSHRELPRSHRASGLLRSELLVFRRKQCEARLRQVVMTSRQIITPRHPGCVNSAVSGTKLFHEQSSIKTRSKMQTCQPFNYLHELWQESDYAEIKIF